MHVHVHAFICMYIVYLEANNSQQQQDILGAGCGHITPVSGLSLSTHSRAILPYPRVVFTPFASLSLRAITRASLLHLLAHPDDFSLSSTGLQIPELMASFLPSPGVTDAGRTEDRSLGWMNAFTEKTMVKF